REQSDCHVREARLVVGRRPHALLHRRPRAARTPRHPVVAQLKKSSVFFQRRAASSARCTGRSGACTKPCSAPSITTISQSLRALGGEVHAARNASMSSAGTNETSD